MPNERLIDLRHWTYKNSKKVKSLEMVEKELDVIYRTLSLINVLRKKNRQGHFRDDDPIHMIIKTFHQTR